MKLLDCRIGLSGLIFLILSGWSQLYAEERVAKNSVFVEGLGVGFHYSVNYERQILDYLGFRVGAAYSLLGGSSYALSFPLTANYWGIGIQPHRLELGAGISINYSSGEGLLANEDGSEIYGTGLVGYRYQLHGGGLLFI